MYKRVISQQMKWGKSIHYSPSTISILGIVGITCFPLYYFVWHDLLPQPYESPSLRIIGMIICLPLIFYSHWPNLLKKYLPVYWDIAVLYSLPFFFTFMLFKNEFNQVWGMSTLVAIFIIMLLTSSWKKFIILFSLGSFLAWSAFTLEQGKLIFPDGLFEYLAIAFFAMFVGSLFNYYSYMSRMKFEKLQTLVAASGNIAHELRTPLLSIKSSIAGLDAYMPALLGAYQQARQHGMDVPLIRKGHEKTLATLSTSIGKEVDYANTVIDMLLVSANQDAIQRDHFGTQSIQHCIQTTLARYPFNSEHDRQCVHWKNSSDFTFRGSDLLTVHILFNLLKNSLYSIAKAGKGDITISISNSENYHHLHFRDTGSGIKDTDLPLVFERFYSTSKYGYGVGLSYCSMVMQSFNGNIECVSVEHEYTEFQLNFPREVS